MKGKRLLLTPCWMWWIIATVRDIPRAPCHCKRFAIQITLAKMNTLVDWLQSYTLIFARTVRGLPDEDCSDYGISLAMLGARSGTYEPSWELYTLPSSGDEPRVLVCGHAAVFGDWHNACSTHLDNDTAGANSQVGDVIWNAAAFNSQYTPATTQYIGGDFNLEPSEFSPFTPYDHWVEADQCCNSPTWDTQGTMDSKLDYGFVEPSYVDAQQAGFWIMPGISDHALVEGQFDRP